MPQIIFDLSTDFLTTAVHDLLPGNVQCSYTGSDGSGVVTIVTQLDVSAVTPIRGDDQDPNTAKILTALATQGAIDLTVDYHQTYGFYGTKTPASFLLVEGTVRVFTESALDDSRSRSHKKARLLFPLCFPSRTSAPESPTPQNQRVHPPVLMLHAVTELCPYGR